MKLPDLKGVVSNCYGQALSMQRTFAAVVIASGLVVVLMSRSLMPGSDDLVEQYLAAKKALRGRLAEEMAETERVINSLVNASRHGDEDFNLTQSSPAPITDPPWMNMPPTAVIPFRAGKVQHPFLRDYVIKNEAVCQNQSVDLLIVIHSLVENVQKRRILRETWAATGSLVGINIKRIFLLGRDHRQEIIHQVTVNTEQATYGDIVQGDFVDSRPNLSVKAVTGLRWINDFCPHARFVLKADDNVFVNTFNLVETYLQRLAGRQRTVMCHVKPANISQIVRNPSSKWFVPPSILPNRTHWPDFCSGYIVVMTTDVVPDLYRASFRAPYVPVDDGYVYGVLPSEVGRGYLQYVDIVRNLTLHETQLLTVYGNASLPLWLVGGLSPQDDSLVKLWQASVIRLSPWALQRASVVRLKTSMPPKGP